MCRLSQTVIKAGLTEAGLQWDLYQKEFDKVRAHANVRLGCIRTYIISWVVLIGATRTDPPSLTCTYPVIARGNAHTVLG